MFPLELKHAGANHHMYRISAPHTRPVRCEPPARSISLRGCAAPQPQNTYETQHMQPDLRTEETHTRASQQTVDTPSALAASVSACGARRERVQPTAEMVYMYLSRLVLERHGHICSALRSVVCVDIRAVCDSV